MGRTDATLSAVHHDSELGRWSFVRQRPSPPLRGLIDGYTGYRQQLAVPATHRGIPTAAARLVISLGPTTTITDPAARGRARAVDSFVSGLFDTHVLLDADEHHGIQVDLRPVAAARLLGRPLRELTGEVVALDEVFGADAQPLVDDLATLPDWGSRFRRLDAALRARLTARPHHLDAEVVHAFDLIGRSRGRVRVGELARATGWSERRLSGRFGAALGLAPKRMARLVRFEHTMALLVAPGSRDLATIAATAGFSDQAHLANDVRAFTGLSATALLARRLPDGGTVYDRGDDRAGSSKTTPAHPS